MGYNFCKDTRKFFSLSLFFFTRTSFTMHNKTYTDTKMPSSYALRNSRALDAAAAGAAAGGGGGGVGVADAAGEGRPPYVFGRFCHA